MPYSIVYQASDGRHIVENTETGERYRQTPDAAWQADLAAWKADVRRRDQCLEPVLRRAAKRGTWLLYNIAKRAAYRLYLPSPMPWGHLMFRGCRRPHIH